VLLYADGATDLEQDRPRARAGREVRRDRPGLTVDVGGSATVSDAITQTVTHDLSRAESVAIPSR